LEPAGKGGIIAYEVGRSEPAGKGGKNEEKKKKKKKPMRRS